MSKVEYIDDVNTWRAGFEFFCPIKVRFGETDMFGHLNNANAFVYFEEARVEFFKHIGLGEEWLYNEKVSNVVANIQCDYLRQVYFDEKLRVYVKIHRIGGASFDLHYMVLNEDNEISLTGKNTVVQMDRETGRSLPLSDEIKSVLAEYQM
jgi:acyl-CoA thioester hydrolase